MLSPELPKLIFPDIHLRQKQVQKVIDSMPNNGVILLGDIVDNYGDTKEDNIAACEWLAGILSDDRNVVLFGNHDISYRYPNNKNLRCVKPDRLLWKEDMNKVLPDDLWDKTKFFHIEDNYLFTHAGFQYQLYKKLHRGLFKNTLEDVEALLGYEVADIHKKLANNENPLLTSAGYARDGITPHGGLNWCDWHSEFFPIPNVRQVFGHSQVKRPQYCYAIDGRMNRGDFDQAPTDGIWTLNYNLDCGGTWFATLNEGKLHFQPTANFL